MIDYLLKFQYDGSYFRGFGKQPHQNTVQDKLEAALKKIFKEEISIFGGSRTDARVHALEQYAIFSASFLILGERLKEALNSIVYEGILVLEARVNTTNLNPRYDCVKKTYKYEISKIKSPFLRRYTYYSHKKLDVSKMQEATKYYLGEHDFSSHCASRTPVTDKIRTIYQLDILETTEKIIITVTGNGFLYNMVRIIVGNLVAVGENLCEPAYIKTIIATKDRTKGFKTMPPEGLYLVGFEFK